MHREQMPLRIAILTQADRLFVPRNVEMICREPGIEVRELIVLDSKGSLENMRSRVVRWFGVVASVRLGLRIVRTIVLDHAARLLGMGGKVRPSSLRSVARRHGVSYSVETSANDPALVERLRAHGVDVLVCFSAPQVFREELLSVSPEGCLNLHCSPLPRYRGLLPSFWVLHHGEDETGATVHRMDTEIDNGDVVRQAVVDIRGVRRMVEVLDRTKLAGGRLMVETLRDLRDGRVLSPLELEGEPSYFSWPTDEDAKAFRKKGYSLA